MQFELENEQIEEIVRQEVTKRVSKWFEKQKQDFLREEFKKALREEIDRQLAERQIDVNKIAASIEPKKVAEMITQRIGEDIGEAFAAMYG